MSRNRREFTTETRKAALKRAKGQCEAVGEFYNLRTGERCTATLANGFQFDHIILEANSKDNSLENCACVCLPCHRIKTRLLDIPLAAKTRAQGEKHQGLRVSDRPFPKRVDPWGRNRRSNVRDIRDDL